MFSELTINKTETFRCFVALDIPDKVVGEIIRVQQRLQDAHLFSGKMTAPQNIHLTLKFLGEITAIQLRDVRKRLEKIRFDSFCCELGELGVFSPTDIRIIWMKLNNESVLQLQKNIDEALNDMFPLEQRFMGHITLARVKSVFNKKELIQMLKEISFERSEFKVKTFKLKLSELFPEGPIYKDIAENELKS